MIGLLPLLAVQAQALPPTAVAVVPTALPAMGYDQPMAPVDTFDPVARAALLVQELPRLWRGSFQPFSGAPPQAVELRLTGVRALGQMVDLRGSLSLAGITTAVQGNLNAKSDQLDLLPVGAQALPGLEPGGFFLGLQDLSLSGWEAPRLSGAGGRLLLQPAASGNASRATSGAPAQRGLW